MVDVIIIARTAPSAMSTSRRNINSGVKSWL
jgi:hypothetical protein